MVTESGGGRGKTKGQIWMALNPGTFHYDLLLMHCRKSPSARPRQVPAGASSSTAPEGTEGGASSSPAFPGKRSLDLGIHGMWPLFSSSPLPTSPPKHQKKRGRDFTGCKMPKFQRWTRNLTLGPAVCHSPASQHLSPSISTVLHRC